MIDQIAEADDESVSDSVGQELDQIDEERLESILTSLQDEIETEQLPEISNGQENNDTNRVLH